MDFCGDQLLQIQEVLINLIDLMYILLLSWINLSSNVISAHFIDVVFSGVFVQVRIWQEKTGKLGEGNAPFTESLVPSSARAGGILGLFLSCSFTQRAEVFASSVSTKPMPWSCATLTCLPIGISLHLRARAAYLKLLPSILEVTGLKFKLGVVIILGQTTAGD